MISSFFTSGNGDRTSGTTNTPNEERRSSLPSKIKKRMKVVPLTANNPLPYRKLSEDKVTKGPLMKGIQKLKKGVPVLRGNRVQPTKLTSRRSSGNSFSRGSFSGSSIREGEHQQQWLQVQDANSSRTRETVWPPGEFPEHRTSPAAFRSQDYIVGGPSVAAANRSPKSDEVERRKVSRLSYSFQTELPPRGVGNSRFTEEKTDTGAKFVEFDLDETADELEEASRTEQLTLEYMERLHREKIELELRKLRLLEICSRRSSGLLYRNTTPPQDPYTVGNGMPSLAVLRKLYDGKNGGGDQESRVSSTTSGETASSKRSRSYVDRIERRIDRK